ncbi:uncharacterized protein TrAtP1_000571 [Trichoderma atroviride]|uniref:uncharacterized protein n=1 Tax=Hypocrea atroviridis TaxID=63577 RepID=UPI00332DFECD|nr:hypothetical protein TrAtP1_000571 [Trichoderma atroviride]
MLFRKFTRLFLERSPWLKSFPNWIDSSIMRQQLLLLLEELNTPELCLILEANADGSYSWKRFGKPSRTQNSKDQDSIEEAVANIYLAHLAQMYHSPATYDARLVLCPKLFMDYMDNPEKRASGLKDIIEKANVVFLEPGKWQNRSKVLKWQASLAVWRKHGKQFEPILTQAAENPHSTLNVPPEYSEKGQPPAYSQQTISTEKFMYLEQ